MWLIWLTSCNKKKKIFIQFGEATITPINNQKNVQTSLSLYCLILRLGMGHAYKLSAKTEVCPLIPPDWRVRGRTWKEPDELFSRSHHTLLSIFNLRKYVESRSNATQQQFSPRCCEWLSVQVESNLLQTTLKAKAVVLIFNKVNLRLSQERDSLTLHIIFFIGMTASTAPAHCCSRTWGRREAKPSNSSTKHGRHLRSAWAAGSPLPGCIHSLLSSMSSSLSS